MEDASPMGSTVTTETIAGCKIRLSRAGSGAPMLFLHGAGGAPAWLPFMEALAQRYDLLVPEHPGFGGSDSPDWLDNIGDLAYFYLDVIEKLGLEDLHLVGASLGGWIAAELAVRNTTRLKSLTLVAPAGIHVKGIRKGDVFMWSADETARRLFHDQELAEAMIAAPQTEATQMARMKNSLALARLAWQPRFYNPHLEKWLHRVNVPTLLIWGQHDQVIPPAYGPAFARLIPNARLEIVADCGHLPYVEQPLEFVALVNRFIGGGGR
jgi:pimeloyl-ACP methyl ester carboxylesterase